MMSPDDEQFRHVFYQALERPLETDDPRYVPLFEDADHAGGDPVGKILRGIDLGTESVQVLSAGGGCGLSTELKRLATRLETKGYEVKRLAVADLDAELSAESVKADQKKTLGGADETTVFLIDCLDPTTAWDRLPQSGAHLIYSIPLGDVILNYDWITSALEEPYFLPCTKLHGFKLSPRNLRGQKALQTLVEKRGDWQRLLHVETHLHRLIELSGGHLGTLIGLFQDLLRRAEHFPLSAEEISSTISRGYHKMKGLVHLEDKQLATLRSEPSLRLEELEALLREQADSGPRRHVEMLRDNVLLHYYSDAHWFELHPLLADPDLDKHRVRPRNGNGLGSHGLGSPSPVPERPLALKQIQIENLRAFDHLTLELEQPKAGAGQWTVLLGDNGVGKTTILRSLVFALSDPGVTNSLFQLMGPGAPFLRDQTRQARLQVGLSEEDFGVQIAGKQQEVERIVEASSPSFSIPLYAYGCQRGTALGGPRRQVEFKPLDDIHSLFDDHAELIHAESWLKELSHAALDSKSPKAQGFFEAVCETLVAILSGVEKIDVDHQGVRLSGDGIGKEVPLAALSDGYVTTAGWLLDLIARWAERCKKLGVELNGDFREKMTALVLIDEIDLHLHPLWQTEIISTLRERFPKLSVVATTHNPLTLLGAGPGEIHVLWREEGRIVTTQADIPLGTHADRVLTGEWFGLPSTIDRDTRRLLADHRTLLRDGTPRSDPNRKELEHQLRLRFGTFADTSIDRIIHSIAAELIGDDFEELTPAARLKIRDKILQRARQRTREAP